MLTSQRTRRDEQRELPVEWDPAARKQLGRLAAAERARILRRVGDLATDPRPHGVTKLAGGDRWRIRIGNYRVVYEIVDEHLVVIVIRVGHRSQVYRGL